MKSYYKNTMDKINETIIINKAIELAKRYNIEDVELVFNILLKTAIDIREFEPKASRLFTDEYIEFYPSLEEALQFLPVAEAMELFKKSNLVELYVKTIIIDYFNMLDTPFYTYDELSELIEKFKKYLEENKYSLIEKGYPKKSFESSFWLYKNLSRLYPIKIPVKTQDICFKDLKKSTLENFGKKDEEGNYIFKYEWAKEYRGPKEHFGKMKNFTYCKYNAAPLFEGLSNQDFEYIEERRARLFNLKIEILNISLNYIKNKKNSDEFWNDCLNVMSKKLPKEDIDTFNLIYKKYFDLFLLNKFEDGSFLVAVNPLTIYSKDLESGGIKNIFDFIYFIEEELKIGRMNKTKTSLISQIGSEEIHSYFQLISYKNINKIDRIIFDFIKYEKQEKDFEEMFNRRLGESFANDFKVEFRVKQKYYNAVKSYVEDKERAEKEGGTLLHYYSPKKPESEYFEEISEGTKWEDIKVEAIEDSKNIHLDTYVCDKKITFSANKIKFKKTFKEVGFSKKNGKLNLQGLLFLVFFQNGGNFSKEDLLSEKFREFRTALNEKILISQKYQLKNLLKKKFGIGDDPFDEPDRISYKKVIKKSKEIPYDEPGEIPYKKATKNYYLTYKLKMIFK